MPIDHLGLNVPAARHQACVTFYLAALAPLGYEKIVELGPNNEWVGLGFKMHPDFWLICSADSPNVKTHVAFRSPDRETVDRFHVAALAAGGKDNGAAGLRTHYHDDHYGAFVLDPVGNNIEVVCHKSEKDLKK